MAVLEVKEKEVIKEAEKILEKSYGSNEFVNRIRLILNHKYDKEIATAMAEPSAVQQARLQSLLLIEVLEELRKLNSAMLISGSEANGTDSHTKG